MVTSVAKSRTPSPETQWLKSPPTTGEHVRTRRAIPEWRLCQIIVDSADAVTPRTVPNSSRKRTQACDNYVPLSPGASPPLSKRCNILDIPIGGEVLSPAMTSTTPRPYALGRPCTRLSRSGKRGNGSTQHTGSLFSGDPRCRPHKDDNRTPPRKKARGAPSMRKKHTPQTSSSTCSDDGHDPCDNTLVRQIRANCKRTNAEAQQARFAIRLGSPLKKKRADTLAVHDEDTIPFTPPCDKRLAQPNAPNDDDTLLCNLIDSDILLPTPPPHSPLVQPSEDETSTSDSSSNNGTNAISSSSSVDDSDVSDTDLEAPLPPLPHADPTSNPHDQDMIQSFFDPPEQYKITTHNMNGAIPSPNTSDKVARQKFNSLKCTIHSCHIACFVEVHAENQDIETLSHHFPHHYLHLLPHHKGRTGGVLISLEKKWIHKHFVYDHDDTQNNIINIAPGRVHLIRLRGQFCALDIIPTHINPRLTDAKRITLSRRIRSQIQPPHLATTVLTGDFNHCVSGEG